ncbi:AraC family transcriptional regulator [Kitasatospora sp. NPDC057904]|uniref:AraC family transcriptional regulator n=1 Tax=unclassified Kitasatospora TaxID=2633591 RepID=UPI0036AC61EF
MPADFDPGPHADDARAGLLYQGGDVEELHALVSAHFSPHRLRVVDHDRRADGQFRRIWAGPVSVYDLGYGTAVEIDPGELARFYNVHIPLAGHGTVTVDGTELPTTLSIAGPGQRLAMAWNGDSLNRVVLITRQALDDALAVRLGDTPSGITRFDPVLDTGSGTVAAWLSTVQSFTRSAESGLLDASPLARGHFEQLLVHGLLDAQPHRISPWSGPDRAAPAGAVGRALAYCSDHAHEPISVADMAVAARVSVRSLRAGFRSRLGTTPLAHLRNVRLEAAHRDLLAMARGEATASTVTEVALRWGFTHLGRFAETYRKTYGRTPSAVLRENRPPRERIH